MQLVVNDTADISLFFEYAQGPQGLPGPKGDIGATGPQGLTGPSGDDAYEVAVSEGFVGTRTQWLASLVGPQGIQGPKGETGAVALTKVDVGLGNVDNTADLDKPISTATQTALNTKADASVVGDIAAALTAINGA